MIDHLANIAALRTADEIAGYRLGLAIQGPLTVELQQALALRAAEIARGK